MAPYVMLSLNLVHVFIIIKAAISLQDVACHVVGYSSWGSQITNVVSNILTDLPS